MVDEEFLSTIMNKVYCGKTPDELKKLPSDKIALTITSPPFFDDELYTLSDGSSEFGWNTYEEYLEHISDMILELFRITLPGGRLVLVLSNSPRTDHTGKILDYWPVIHDTITMGIKIGWDLQDEAVWIMEKPAYDGIRMGKVPEIQLVPHHDWISVLRKPGKREEIKESYLLKSTWQMPNEGPNRRYNRSYGSFPHEFIENCLKCWSLPGDIILDPYAGSAQTIRIALKLNRNAIGIESDPKWVDLWDDINNE
ncbi:MAG: DNA-methyltransferase [Candidatus Kariarchaeaceae archaeon]|jgi:site-specific DNA-methyltransferase (adenine-specific)